MAADWFKEESKKPKKDGSGKGIRANRGRGGCDFTESFGKGRNFRRDLGTMAVIGGSAVLLGEALGD